jgi:hypothetical protein
MKEDDVRAAQMLAGLVQIETNKIKQDMQAGGTHRTQPPQRPIVTQQPGMPPTQLSKYGINDINIRSVLHYNEHPDAERLYPREVPPAMQQPPPPQSMPQQQQQPPPPQPMQSQQQPPSDMSYAVGQIQQLTAPERSPSIPQQQQPLQSLPDSQQTEFNFVEKAEKQTEQSMLEKINNRLALIESNYNNIISLLKEIKENTKKRKYTKKKKEENAEIPYYNSTATTTETYKDQQ